MEYSLFSLYFLYHTVPWVAAFAIYLQMFESIPTMYITFSFD